MKSLIGEARIYILPKSQNCKHSLLARIILKGSLHTI